MKTLAVLQDLQLAKVMFYFLLVVFVVVLTALLCAVFWAKTDTLTSGGLAILDGLIGWSLRHMVTYLFPSDKQSLFKRITRRYLTGDKTGKDQ